MIQSAVDRAEPPTRALVPSETENSETEDLTTVYNYKKVKTEWSVLQERRTYLLNST